MEILFGSGHLSEDAFVEAFETCTLPNQNFRHADHVRLAWIYVRRHGEAAATERIAEAIQRFATHNGAPGKYDDALTRAWMRRIAEAVRESNGAETILEFVEAHPGLLVKNAS